MMDTLHRLRRDHRLRGLRGGTAHLRVEKREPGVNTGSKALPCEIFPLFPSWPLRPLLRGGAFKLSGSHADG